MQLFRVRRRRHLLSLHEIRAPVHLRSVYNPTNGAGRGAAEGLGNAVRGSSYGRSFPSEHCVPQQAGARTE